MSLATYHKKRHFERTPEPKGRALSRGTGALQFVVQKHDASRLHYDFRLELDGVLKSWAVPKGPSLDPVHKSLAVQVEDHPIDYGDFEGVIPKGEYGGGTVLLWDRGTWEPLGDPEKGMRQGKLHFTLHGKKLRGEWALVRMHGKAGGDGKNWLLIKSKDRFATTRDVLNAESKSVKSSRAMADKACGMNLEGIISKRVDAPYVSRRDTSWLKSKCRMRQEFVIIGYTDPRGARSGFGSLLLGYQDERGELTYAGRVGTGFDEKFLKQTVRRLRAIEQAKSPTAKAPPAREVHSAHWVKPTIVAEVKFSGWTRDGMLRHPIFVAFRSDKPAAQIVRERAVEPRKMKAPVNKAVNGSGQVTFAGVALSHPDKIFYADSRTTKRELAAYYEMVQEWMLPHVVERPLALVRCPQGTSAKCFFQRNWSATLPAAVDKVNVGKGKAREYHVAIHDLAGVISLAQIGVLEIHGWNCRSENVERPDQLIFDLDPGPGLAWKQVVKAARRVNLALESLHLPTFAKTSGGKGIHITIPIKPNIDWDTAKSFCGTIAKSLAEESDQFVANMRKDLREGKVYIDYNRNGRSATAVAPYSTRARAGAPVAMPISWDELGKLQSADHFKVETVGQYLRKRKMDPWRDFERSRVDLLKVIGRKSAA